MHHGGGGCVRVCEALLGRWRTRRIHASAVMDYDMTTRACVRNPNSNERSHLVTK
jgi:hypothetical protein